MYNQSTQDNVKIQDSIFDSGDIEYIVFVASALDGRSLYKI